MHFKKLLLLFLIVSSFVISSNPLISIGLSIISTVIGICSLSISTWQIVDRIDQLQSKDISHYVDKVNSEIKNLKDSVEKTNYAIYQLVKRFNANTRLELKLNELSTLVSKVDIAYQTFTNHMKNFDETEKLTLEDFATWTVSQNPMAIAGLLERIHKITIPVAEPGLINTGVHSTLLDVLKKTDIYMCDMQQSSNQLLYNMYNIIILTEIKGFVMLQVSWMILKMYEKGKFTVERDTSMQRFKEKVQLILTTAKFNLNKADRQFRKCEPSSYIENETFTSLTRLLQGYIENETNMNKWNTCGQTCDDHKDTKYDSCYAQDFCEKQPPCMGNILNCHYIQWESHVCQALRPSHRRYEWVEFQNPKTMYGKHEVCKTKVTVISWVRVFYHCSYCMCICDQIGPDSDRYFSLKASVADIVTNKVVTGIRFVKQNRIIHMQINEGTLMPGGRIDPKSVSWKNIDTTLLNDLNIDKDYYMMTYKDRAIDLDDLEAPTGQVMTGVRFRKLQAHLQFEIQVTSFDFNTGELNTKTSIWINNSNIPNRSTRTELVFKSPDVPTRLYISSEPKSKSNQFLQFTHTDFVKDVAQTTVPYLDTQPVELKIPVPLSGAGIFFKGDLESGGFIAPKIFTYDVSAHMPEKIF